MTPLVDVNCLMALAWPNHVHHGHVRGWFPARAAGPWATTPGVQSAFIRLSMNPHVTGGSVAFTQAADVLSRLLAFGKHRTVESVPGPTTWPQWLSIRVQGHRQVTDASLLACALVNDLVLVTLDAGVQDLTDEAHRDLVQLVLA